MYTFNIWLCRYSTSMFIHVHVHVCTHLILACLPFPSLSPLIPSSFPPSLLFASPLPPPPSLPLTLPLTLPPSSEQFIQRKTRPGHFSHSGEPPQLSLPLSVHMHTFLMYCTCTYAIWTQRVLCKHVQLMAQKLFPSNLHVISSNLSYVYMYISLVPTPRN